MSEAGVEDLLYNKLRLNMKVDDLHDYVDKLKRTGRVTLEDIETGEAELAASGPVHLHTPGS